MSAHRVLGLRGASRREGFALIAVLVALSILLTLAAPFLLSMEHGDAVSQDLADERHVALASESVRDLVLAQAARTHESSQAHAHCSA